MRHFLIAMLLLFFLPAAAQKTTLQGRVLDQDDRGPLPFASVFIKDKPLSTVTNLQGEFDFHFPAAFADLP